MFNKSVPELKDWSAALRNAGFDPDQIYRRHRSAAGLEEAGLEISHVRSVPPAIFDRYAEGYAPAPPPERPLAVYVEPFEWDDAAKAQLQEGVERGWIRLVPDAEASSAEVVIGGPGTGIRPGQAVLRVGSLAAARSVTADLLVHLKNKGDFKPGALLFLYRGDLGEDLLIFA